MTARILPAMAAQVGRHKLEDDMMKTIILAASAALALAAAAPAEAGSWTSHWTGPQGGTYEGGGDCASGACRTSGTFTGPMGGVWHHTGNLHQVGPGQWAGERTIVGPGGRTWHNTWTWHSGGNGL